MDNINLQTIKFCFRTQRALSNAGIHTLDDLLKESYGSLIKKTDFTNAVVKGIRQKLAFHGLALAGDILVRSEAGVALTHDIPKLCEKIVEEIRSLNDYFRNMRIRINELEELINRIISNENYKNDR